MFEYLFHTLKPEKRQKVQRKQLFCTAGDPQIFNGTLV